MLCEMAILQVSGTPGGEGKQEKSQGSCRQGIAESMP